MPTYVDAVYLPARSARKKRRPLSLVPVAAGFTSPADDYLEWALDLNERMGAGTLRYAAEGYVKRWRTRFERRSPVNTTDWQKLPTVRTSK